MLSLKKTTRNGNHLTATLVVGFGFVAVIGIGWCSSRAKQEHTFRCSGKFVALSLALSLSLSLRDVFVLVVVCRAGSVGGHTGRSCPSNLVYMDHERLQHPMDSFFFAMIYLSCYVALSEFVSSKKISVVVHSNHFGIVRV